MESNIQPLIDCSTMPNWANSPPNSLFTLLMFDAFHDVEEKAKNGNANARAGSSRGPMPSGSRGNQTWRMRSKLTVFKVTSRDQHRRPVAGTGRVVASGHPAARIGDAENARDGIEPDHAGRSARCRRSMPSSNKSFPVAYVGDVVAPDRRASPRPTRCSWHMGDDIRSCPTNAPVAWCSGGKIAPIFFNTVEDSGAADRVPG